MTNTIKITKEITFGGDGDLTSQLLQHFGGPCETIAAFPNADVEYKFVDFELLHGVLCPPFGWCGGLVEHG